MTPSEELERFFKDVHPIERENVERYEEYHRALAANDIISAMEIASAIMSGNKDMGQLDKLFRNKFPKYSN